MSFPLPPNEQERLAALQRFQILDTPPEAAFDRIARIAKRVFGVPVAFVSLIDHDRQWFKACYGWNAIPLPREVAFCAHAIIADEAFVVPDASLDPRFAANPLVTGELGVRFYAGAPLTSRDRHNLGTLAIADFVPRTLSDDEQATLRDLAEEVAQLFDQRLEKREAQEEIEERRRLEEALSRLAAIVHSSADAIIGVAEGVISQWNAAAERLFGFGATEAIGQSATLLVPPERAGEISLVLEAALRGETVAAQEMTGRHKDGHLLDVSLSASPVRDGSGRFLGACVIVRDISGRKRAKKALRQAKDTLEERVTQRTGELSRANDELRESEDRYRTLVENLNEVVYLLENTPDPTKGGVKPLINLTFFPKEVKMVFHLFYQSHGFFGSRSQ